MLIDIGRILREVPRASSVLKVAATLRSRGKNETEIVDSLKTLYPNVDRDKFVDILAVTSNFAQVKRADRPSFEHLQACAELEISAALDDDKANSTNNDASASNNNQPSIITMRASLDALVGFIDGNCEVQSHELAQKDLENESDLLESDDDDDEEDNNIIKSVLSGHDRTFDGKRMDIPDDAIRVPHQKRSEKLRAKATIKPPGEVGTKRKTMDS